MPEAGKSLDFGPYQCHTGLRALGVAKRLDGWGWSDLRTVASSLRSAVISAMARVRTHRLQGAKGLPVPRRFGRFLWWTEESPLSLSIATLCLLVVLLIAWLLTFRRGPVDASQEIALGLEFIDMAMADSAPAAAAQQVENEVLFGELRTPTASAFPKVPTPKPIDGPAPTSLVDLARPWQDAVPQLASEAEAARQLAEQLKAALQGKAQTDRGQGLGGDPNSTVSRMHRWLIVYPLLNDDAYRGVLDYFDVELAWLKPPDQLHYAFIDSGRLRTRVGSLAEENRIFWEPIGQPSFPSDRRLLHKFRLGPGQAVLHLYPKKVEEHLADLERFELKRRYGTDDLRLVEETVFEIVRTSNGNWGFKVRSIRLSPR
jgi:hypothetical protein